MAAILRQLLDDASYREEPGAQAERDFRSHFLWNNVQDESQAFISGLVS
jgi:hypothetical protein